MDRPPDYLEVMKWTDEEARAFVERMRWPDGPHCPKCGVDKPYTFTRKSRTKNKITSLYKCRDCKKQFSSTVGTIFEDSKIPLSKWLAAIYLMCASKKGVSAHQLHRMLKITYKSAWFMCHRVREAAKSFPVLSGVVEADETYMGKKTRRGHPVWHERVKDEIEQGIRPKPASKPPYQDKTTVLGLVERGGTVHSRVIPKTTVEHVKPVMTKMLDVKNVILITDKHPVYRGMGKIMPHMSINHEEAYVRGPVHTQTIEGYWSLVKRSIYGTFHHVGDGFLPMYLSEMDFRYSHRKLSDAERFHHLMTQMAGQRLLWFCKTPQPQNPYAAQRPIEPLQLPQTIEDADSHAGPTAA